MGNFLGAAGLTRVWNKIAATYLKLSGGALSDNAVISRTGTSVAWVNGRNNPIIKTSSYTGYNAILSMKTTNGSWDLGVYSDDKAYLTYITDTNYGAGSNSTTYQLVFPKSNGTLALTSQIPTVNNGTLHLQASGTDVKTFTANQSGDTTLNIATGSSNGTIAVGGTNVSVKGLGSAAYTASTAYASSSHTHSYLPLSGGTMTGPLKWNNDNALPERNSIDYVLTIDAFASGGQTYWASIATLKSSLGLGSNAYTSTSYLPTGGGTMAGTLKLTPGVGISESSADNGLLVYHPSDWTGVSSSQWGLGTINSQGVIRSSAADLIHYRGNNSYVIWDSANDGSGSGLDADTLDGYHAGHFGYMATYGQSDCNEVGPWLAAYRFDSTVYNAFYGASYGNMLCVGGGDGMDTEFQIGAPYYTQELYFRTGTWYGNDGTIRSASWNRIWHENNDGSGSGLDADTVDGEQASAFAHRATANNLLVGGNEFNFISAGFSGDVYLNYQDENRRGDANVSGYNICNGRSGIMAYIGAGGSYLNNYLRIGGSTTDTMTTATTNPRLIFAEDHTTQAVGIVYTDWDLYRPGKGLKIMDLDGNDPDVWFEVAGNIIATGSVTAGSASDIRLKENISELDIHKVLNILRQLKPKKFNWNSLALELDPMKDKETTHLGYIAQEVEKLIPGAVTDDYFEVYKRLNPIEIIPLLHAAIIYILEKLQP